MTTSMTSDDFFIYLGLIATAYFAKDVILYFINRIIKNQFHSTKFKVKTSWFSYFLLLLAVWVVVLGMFIDKKPTYGQMSVSESMQKLKPKGEDKLFNIPFDIFNF